MFIAVCSNVKLFKATSHSCVIWTKANKDATNQKIDAGVMVEAAKSKIHQVSEQFVFNGFSFKQI